MAQKKEKKAVKVRDLKPSKDAKGGAARHADLGQRGHQADFAAKRKSGLDFRAR